MFFKANQTAGFSLLEVLVVIVIVSVLAAMVVPQYTKVMKTGRASEAASNIGNIVGAMIRYYAETGETTTIISDLDITLDGAKFDYSIKRFKRVDGEDDMKLDMKVIAEGNRDSVEDICVYYDNTNGEDTDEEDTDIHIDVDNSDGKCN